MSSILALPEDLLGDIIEKVYVDSHAMHERVRVREHPCGDLMLTCKGFLSAFKVRKPAVSTVWCNSAEDIDAIGTHVGSDAGRSI